MELRHLRYFVAVAESLSFRQAAVRLHVSQPPLSVQIADLERELGVKLIDRGKQKISLTNAGLAFFPRAQQLLRDADSAKTLARRAGQGKVGSLSLRFISSAVTGVCKRQFPHLKRLTPISISRSNSRTSKLF